MPLIRPGIRRLFALGTRTRARAEREVDEEIDLHLDLRAEQLRREGVPVDEARREALRRFGSMHDVRLSLGRSAHRRNRRMGMREWFDATAQDVRYSLRGFRRDPMFTTFAVVTLALGIGANAAMFGVVDRLLIRGPEHVVEPERLVRFSATMPRRQFGEVTSGSFGYVMYDNLRQSAQLFDGVAAWKVDRAPFGSGRDARQIPLGSATAGFFPLLGVHPELGRFFLPDEDDVSTPSPVAVLGNAFWRTRFGGDSSVLGATVTIGDEPFTVIGVAPAGFTGVDLGRVDAWIPMSWYSRHVTANWSRSWNAQWLHVVGRLATGVSREAAGHDATRAHLATYDGRPESSMARARINADPIRFTDAGHESSEIVVARWLVGVTLIVLLIACTNVANLLLARAIRRRGEVGIRLALGAGRARLARLFLTEGILLAMLGGVAALLVATWIGALVRQSLLSNIEWTTAPVSQRVLVVAMAVALTVGLLMGVVPALHASRGSLTQAIQRGRPSGRGVGIGQWPTVLQACLAAMLLIGAGLFLRSLHRAETIPLGFDSHRIVVGEIVFSAAVSGSDGRDRRAASWQQALERVRILPGVERAAVAVGSPFGNSFAPQLSVPGWDSIPRLPGGGPYISAVTGDYFATVGTRVLRGRVFTATEGTGTEPVAIVNETMARILWPGREAIGQCLRIEEDTAPCSQVVGIVEDARRYELKEDPVMQYYIPLGQERGFGGSVLLVRPRGDVLPLVAQVQSVLETGDALVEHANTYPMRQLIDPLLRPWRLGATIFGMGGVLALLVAALGLYSVMSYSVAQRSHEVGVRLALGATTRSIVGLIVRQSMTMAAAGLVAGVAITLWAGRYLERLLFNTSARDPMVILTTVLVLLAAAGAASLLPAMRARRVDPIQALRAD